MSDQKQIAIAVVNPTAGTDEAQNALAKLFGKQPRRIEMFGLAGPNDTLQILLDWATWQTFSGVVVAAYFVKLAQMAAEQTPAAVKRWLSKNKPAAPATESENDQAVAKLLLAIETAQNAGNSVILGFPIDSSRFYRRNLGIQLRQVTPDELAKAAIALASIGPDLIATIESALREGSVYAFEENDDCSAKITLNDDGSCLVRIIASKTGDFSKDGQHLTIYYDPEGRRKE